jgi:multidrug efflux pump subunit AcrA (membrane-fusion protein)
MTKPKTNSATVDRETTKTQTEEEQMKRSTETTRFLNHVEREQNKIRTKLNLKIAVERAAVDSERSARISAERELHALRAKNAALDTALASATLTAESMLSAARALLPKIRVNIYTNSTKCTPHWFKTGKWWSRETGGLDADFVAEMTADEILEAFDFYGSTELPLMLPRSHRAEIAEAV